MDRRHWLALACALALGAGAAWGGRADAGFHPYYSRWHPATRYSYYRTYYYQPNAYDYVLYYPKLQPRYLYYYNPVARTYWGRFDVKTKGYSLLAEADRKGALKDIPDSKFPEPADLPPVHGDKDQDKVEAPPTDDLPIDLPPPEDIGTKTETKADGTTDTKTDTPKPQPDPKPGPDGGGVTPKPDPVEGTAAPVPAPKPAPTPAPPDGGNAAPPAPRPAPVPGDTPFQLPPGKGGCDRRCPADR